MQETDQQQLSILVAELRNAITPALLYLEALDESAETARPAAETELLRRAELRLLEVEQRAGELAGICRERSGAGLPAAS